ncbi:hypothetical protein CJU89_5280 [Yarrowia sp. B02]|nr:hypothetical protein CJU89_5280 [Yarrowia sp. B02]
MVSPYLGYIQPNDELTHIILCAVPYIGYGGDMSFDISCQQFAVTYNGYLYYLHEGRFTLLWVDLGYQKLLKMKSQVRAQIAHNTLAQKTDTRALTAINAFVPPMGTFAPQVELFRNHGIVQGDKNKGCGRFVTLRRAYGHMVADLWSGKTYVCKTSKDARSLAIPYISNKKKRTVGFYTFSPFISHFLSIKLDQMHENKAPLDLASAYDSAIRRHSVASKSYPEIDPYYDADPDKVDFFKYVRRIHPSHPLFSDTPTEFTNIDAGEELKLHEGHMTDEEDWDGGDETGRSHPDHDISSSSENEYDSDQGKDPVQVRAKYGGKLPSVYQKKGKIDGKRGRPDDRYNNQAYYKAYHKAYRERFGYVDNDDKDDYWGSNPDHGPWYLS